MGGASERAGMGLMRALWTLQRLRWARWRSMSQANLGRLDVDAMRARRH